MPMTPYGTSPSARRGCCRGIGPCLPILRPGHRSLGRSSATRPPRFRGNRSPSIRWLTSICRARVEPTLHLSGSMPIDAESLASLRRRYPDAERGYVGVDAWRWETEIFAALPNLRHVLINRPRRRRRRCGDCGGTGGNDRPAVAGRHRRRDDPSLASAGRPGLVCRSVRNWCGLYLLEAPVTNAGVGSVGPVAEPAAAGD